MCLLRTQVLPKAISKILQEFSESIAYTNGVSGNRYRKAQVTENLKDKQEQETKKPFRKDELVFVVPQNMEDGKDPGTEPVHTPLWLAKMHQVCVSGLGLSTCRSVCLSLSRFVSVCGVVASCCCKCPRMRRYPKGACNACPTLTSWTFRGTYAGRGKGRALK